MKKIITTLTSVAVLLFVLVTPAFAHVTVKPNQAGVAAFQTFTMGVPNEKDNPTVSLRLVIPEGLEYVSPNVKPGWTINVKKTGEGEEAKVTEISWTGGSIPAGQRDDFLLSAKVPATETTINWKAYQTYENGDVVSWDQNPDAMKNMTDEQKEENEKTGKGPYSSTKIINDLTGSSPSNESHSMKENNTMSSTDISDKTQWLFGISIAALALSVVSLGMQLKNRK